MFERTKLGNFYISVIASLSTALGKIKGNTDKIKHSVWIRSNLSLTFCHSSLTDAETSVKSFDGIKTKLYSVIMFLGWKFLSVCVSAGQMEAA